MVSPDADYSGARTPAPNLIAYARDQTQRTRRVLDVSAPLPAADSFPGYTLLREIHRGGQGVVYLAREESTTKHVAIKVLRDGAFAGPADRSRLERETRILARLDHPNLVGIRARGEIDGQVYFAMDYVDGDPLDEYVRRVRPTNREVVELFATICETVHAAHVRGVIHRDLKPSNIRVSRDGRPYVLDFGTAKLVASEEGLQSAAQSVTVTGQFVGSLPWASPEQVRCVSDELDTRSDVYALGVILYHLLTDHFPYDVRGPVASVFNQISEAEPRALRSYVPRLDTDLETIVLRCLRKDPARRYQSAGELGRDLRHYVKGEPIEARRDSTWYVFTKTVTRHWVVSASAGLLLAVTSAYALSMTVLYQKKVAAEVRAESAARAAGFGDFLTAMLNEVEKWPAARETKLVDALRFVDTYISSKPGASPSDEATLRLRIGGAFRRFGLYDLAEQQMQAGVDLRKTLLGWDAEATVEARTALGLLWNDAEKLVEAEGALRSALAAHREIASEDHSLVVWKKMYLADVLEKMRKLDEADELYRQAVESFRRNPGERFVNYYNAVNNYLVFLVNQGRLVQAEPLVREAVAVLSEHMGATDDRTLHMQSNVGRVLFELGRPAEAEPIYRLLLDDYRSRHGEKVPGARVMHLFNLGEALRVLHRLEESDRLLREALAVQERERGSVDRTTLTVRGGVAEVCLAAGSLDEAERRVEELLNDGPAVWGTASGELYETKSLLGRIRAERGRADEAIRLLTEAVDGLERASGAGNLETLEAGCFLGRLYLAHGRPDLAEIVLCKSLDDARGAVPEDHWLVGALKGNYGAVLLARGMFAEAERELVPSLGVVSERLGGEHPETQAVLHHLVDLYTASSNVEEARRYRNLLTADGASK